MLSQLVDKELRKKYKLEYKKFYDYRYHANLREIDFNLSWEEFLTFWQIPCYYCNSKIPTIGLDRVDSDEAYCMSNIVPCCRRCNMMKMATPQDIFIEQCKKVVRQQTKIRKQLRLNQN